jgi:hypothetical protein
MDNRIYTDGCFQHEPKTPPVNLSAKRICHLHNIVVLRVCMKDYVSSSRRQSRRGAILEMPAEFRDSIPYSPVKPGQSQSNHFQNPAKSIQILQNIEVVQLMKTPSPLHSVFGSSQSK